MEAETSRDRQRLRTRARIAEVALRLFVEQGFDRTSIRQIAQGAEVDPALVMHYFGNKRSLFQSLAAPPEPPPADRTSDPLDVALSALVGKLENPSAAATARLRSMLTHPDASDYAREEIDRRAAALAAVMTGPHARERAALILAINLGVTVARELLGVDALASASVPELVRLLRPAHEALVADSVSRAGAAGPPAR
ncbi:MAG: TetR family transcriptional regulator [Blastococcus sp.]